MAYTGPPVADPAGAGAAATQFWGRQLSMPVRFQVQRTVQVRRVQGQAKVQGSRLHIGTLSFRAFEQGVSCTWMSLQQYPEQQNRRQLILPCHLVWLWINPPTFLCFTPVRTHAQVAALQFLGVMVPLRDGLRCWPNQGKQASNVHLHGGMQAGLPVCDTSPLRHHHMVGTLVAWRLTLWAGPSAQHHSASAQSMHRHSAIAAAAAAMHRMA